MKECLIYLLCKLFPSASLRAKAKSRLCTKDKGIGNSVKLCSEFYGKVRIFGNNNKIIIGETKRPFKLRILVVGDNNTVCIGKNVQIKGASLSIGTKRSTADHVVFSVGEATSFVDKNYFYLYENECSLRIGKNCMFSNLITIRCGEKPHGLIDRKTGEVLTGKYAVSIGDHCWIGTNCFIMKNAGLADNTIVGSCSVVTKRFDAGYCVVAGNPAKVVKEEVDWVENVAAYVKNCGSQG